MGLFSFLTKKKENKEDLDKGLEKTKTSVFSRISKAIMGKSTVDDEVLDNLEEILITSDVGVETTLKIIDRIQARVALEIREKTLVLVFSSPLSRSSLFSFFLVRNENRPMIFKIYKHKKALP